MSYETTDLDRISIQVLRKIAREGSSLEMATGIVHALETWIGGHRSASGDVSARDALAFLRRAIDGIKADARGEKWEP